MTVDTRDLDEARAESIHSRGKGDALALASGLELREFVSKECGAQGFSTGTATFHPGAALAYRIGVLATARERAVT